MRNANYLLFISLFTLFLVACKPKVPEITIIPDSKKNHLQRLHLSGNVKEVFVTVFSVEELNDSTFNYIDTLSYSLQTFTGDGYLTAYLKFSPQMDTISAKSFTYYPDARDKSWKEYSYISHDSYFGETEYDMNNFKSGEKVYKNDSLSLSFSYKTDGMGNIIEMQQNYQSYSITNKMYYNQFGLVEKIEEYEPNGKLFKYVTIEYDNYGDEVNRCAYKSGDALIEYTYTKYDENGVLQKVLFEDKLHNSREEYLYQDYDKYHNWTTELRKKNGKINYIRKREIKYYQSN